MLINGTEDLRIQKTMSAIKESFEALICEKEYNEITVTELCQRAKINKKTFYHYYPTLDDLLREMQMELSSAYIDLGEGEPDLLRVLRRPGPGLRENHLFFRQLLGLPAGHVPAGYGCHMGQISRISKAESGSAESGVDLHQQLRRGVLPSVGSRWKESPFGTGNQIIRYADVRRIGQIL